MENVDDSLVKILLIVSFMGGDSHLLHKQSNANALAVKPESALHSGRRCID